MTTKQSFSAKTLDQALDEAAKFFGVDRSAVSYETQNAGGGLLSKLFSRSIRIEAWVEEKKDLKQAARDAVRAALNKDSNESHGNTNNHSQPRADHKKDGQQNHSQTRGQQQQPNRAPQQQKQQPLHSNTQNQRPKGPGQNQVRPQRLPQQQPRPQNTEPRAPRPPREPHPDRPSFTFQSPGIKEIFDEFSVRFNQVFETQKGKLEEVEGQIRVFLESEFLENTLAKTDRLSTAFEHVFKRIAQKKIGDVIDRISIEAGASAERRQEHLKEMALSIADKVKRTGRAITLAAKSAAERRVIHLSLDGQEGVATKSVGSGDERKLIIFSTNPEHKQQSRRRRGGRGRGGRQTDGGGVNADTANAGETGSENEGQQTATTSVEGHDNGGPRRSRNRRRGRNRRPREEGQSVGNANSEPGGQSFESGQSEV